MTEAGEFAPQPEAIGPARTTAINKQLDSHGRDTWNKFGAPVTGVSNGMGVKSSYSTARKEKFLHKLEMAEALNTRHGMVMFGDEDLAVYKEIQDEQHIVDLMKYLFSPQGLNLDLRKPADYLYLKQVAPWALEKVEEVWNDDAKNIRRAVELRNRLPLNEEELLESKMRFFKSIAGMDEVTNRYDASGKMRVTNLGVNTVMNYPKLLSTERRFHGSSHFGLKTGAAGPFNDAVPHEPETLPPPRFGNTSAGFAFAQNPPLRYRGPLIEE